MVVGSKPGLELAYGPHDGIDLTPQIILDWTQPPNGFPRSDRTNDQKVYVASGRRGPRGHGPEDEGRIDAGALEGAFQYFDQPFSLQENIAQGGEKGVPFVGAEVPSVAMPALDK